MAKYRIVHLIEENTFIVQSRLFWSWFTESYYIGEFAGSEDFKFESIKDAEEFIHKKYCKRKIKTRIVKEITL